MPGDYGTAAIVWDSRNIYVGPCAAKKLEAIPADIRSDVDFVLTFEELMSMFEGKYTDYLLESMGCPGGCVAGPGTIISVDKAAKFVEKYSKEAQTASPTESPYRYVGEKLD